MGVRIEPYTQDTLPTGSINTPVSSGAFGMDTARGLQDLAQGLGEFGDHVRQVEEDQGRIWAATAVSQKELALQQTFHERVNSLDPTDPNYAKKIADLTEQTQADTVQAQDDLTEQAPSRFAKRFVAVHMSSAGLRLNDMAMRTQSQLNADYTRNLVQDGIKADSDVLAATPDNDTYGRLLQKQHDAIVGLTTIDPTVKQALFQQAAHTYANVQVSSVVAKDPQSFLTLVNAQGSTLNNRGRTTGAVPTAGPQSQMLAFANEQIKAGKSPEDAMQALTKQFPDVANKFDFAFKDGQFSVIGNPPSDPQVQPLDEQDIAKADVPIAGWSKLTWPEKVSYVRQAEAQVGKQVAEDRGALSRELQDASATLRAGQDYPGLNSDRYSQANLERVFGPDQGARMAKQLHYDQMVGQFMKSVSTMPAEQRAATLDQLKPQGGEGFAAAEPVFKMAAEAAQRVATAQVTKPIQYAIEAGIGGARPIDFSQPLQDQLVARAKVANTMMRDYGAKPQIFTDGEVKSLADNIGNLPGNQRINLLEQIRQGLNDPRAFGQAMNEFAPKNPNLAYAANLAAVGGTSYVDGHAIPDMDIATRIADGDIILNGRKLDTKAGTDGEPSMPSGAKAIKFDDTGFRQAFNEQLNGAFQSPDAQRSAATETETYNAVKAYYVAEAYQQGKSLDVADPRLIKNAIAAVVGTPVSIGNGRLLAPHGMPVDQFQTQWGARAEQAFKAAGYSSDDTSRLLDRTVPVNLSDGRYGFQNGTRLQTDASGRPVIVDYRTPMPVSTPTPLTMPGAGGA